MSYPELQGRKAIALLRCSTSEQPKSIEDQLRICQNFANQHGIEIVGEARFESVSASVTANLDRIIADLIERKQRRDDFDSILVHDGTRFSRSMPEHASKMRWELGQAGIEVVKCIGYVSPGPYSSVMNTLDATIAHEQARSIAASVARGAQFSIEQGTRAHCATPPIGVDRMIQDAEGKDLFVIRNLRDGSQVRIDPETKSVVEHFPRRVGSASGHFKKSRGQRIALLPGDPDDVGIVQQIFERYEISGWGYHSIAAELNDKGATTKTGGLWYIKSVRDVLMNPTYCGRGLANARTRAIYYERSRGAPLDAKKRGRRSDSGRPAVVFRSPEEWEWVDLPRLREFLPEAIRDKAFARQKRLLADRANGVNRRPAKDKHIKSDFLLKDVLQTSDGHRMTGRRSGRNGMYRQYALTRSIQTPKSSAPSPRIRAEAIEEPILAELKNILFQMPSLRDRVLEASLTWHQSRHSDSDQAELEKRLAAINRRIGVILKVDSDDDELARQLSELVDEKSEINARLGTDSELEALDDAEVETVVDALLENFILLGLLLDEFDPSAIRQVVNVFVEKAVADLDKREVSVVFRIPSWAMVEDRMMGLDQPSDARPSVEAHRLLVFQRRFSIPKLWRRVA